MVVPPHAVRAAYILQGMRISDYEGEIHGGSSDACLVDANFLCETLLEKLGDQGAGAGTVGLPALWMAMTTRNNLSGQIEQQAQATNSS